MRRLPVPGWRRRNGRRREMAEINLARRPFVNERPVRRVALLALVGGLILAAANGWLYTRYVIQRGANEGELDRIAEQIAREERRIAQLSEGLAAADLTQQNQLVAFLNQRIAERTFGWSVLFDRLEELLPADVRLVSLSPREIERGAQPVARAAAAEQRFNLGLAGVAREPSAVLELIDALFADPAFRDPDIHQESFHDGGVGFTLDVIYLPEVAQALAGAAEPAAPAATAAAADSVLSAAATPPRREESP